MDPDPSLPDTRTLAQVASSAGNGYNDPDTRLDPESLHTIVDWLRDVCNPT